MNAEPLRPKNAIASQTKRASRDTMKQIVAAHRWTRPTNLLILGLAVVTAFCIPLRPLWVDEIYQLEATRDQSFLTMLHSSLVAPGGMPFAYLLQKVWIEIAGFSTLQARIPAAFFGLASVAATAWTASLLEENAALVATASLLTPLLFRYTTEARPYSQGLFFSILSTAFFLRWWNEQRTAQSNKTLVPYSLSLIAGIYSQPFALFTAVAHALTVMLHNRKRLLPIILAIAVPVLCFLPWFLLAHEALKHEAWPHLMFFSWHQVSPLMIVRELSGGGYVCSVLLLTLAALGIRRCRNASLLVSAAIVPVILAILADAAANYFFAIRQLIFVLPPMIVLAVAGFSILWSRHRAWAALVASLYAIAALTKDIRWQADHKENWALAAAYLQAKAQEKNACISFEPSRDAPSYYFFEESLKTRQCSSNAGPRLIAVSPYADAKSRKAYASARNIGNTLIAEE